VTSKERTVDDIRINRITVSEAGEETIQKKAGTYITIFADGVKTQDTKRQGNASKELAKELMWMMKQNNVKPMEKGLIVGLGNWNVTPEALGPMTIDKVMVTNQLFELEYETVQEGYRPIGALSLAVMGVTCMESSDLVLSLIDDCALDLVIVIVAVASRSIERINETILLTEPGIHPVSGVGTQRKEL